MRPYSEITNLYDVGVDVWFFERIFNLTKENGILITFNYTGAGDLDVFLVADVFMDLFYDYGTIQHSYESSGQVGIYWDVPYNTIV